MVSFNVSFSNLATLSTFFNLVVESEILFSDDVGVSRQANIGFYMAIILQDIGCNFN